MRLILAALLLALVAPTYADTGSVATGGIGGAPPAGSITATITASRTSGDCPLAVFFTGRNSTHADGRIPFLDLYYEWDFGDTAAGTWATDGKDKNVDHSVNAIHVFDCGDADGTKTVTLTVRDELGNVASTTQVITLVGEDTKYPGTETICVSTDGTHTGCPAGADTFTYTDWILALNDKVVGDRRILFHRAQTFTSSANANTFTASTGNLIGAYGSGAKPILNYTRADGLGAVLDFSAAASQWVLEDLHIVRSSGGALSDIAIELGTDADRILFLNVDVTDFDHPVSAWNIDNKRQELFMVGGTLTHNITRVATTGNTFNWSTQKGGVVGVTAVHSSIPPEHILRVPWMEDAVIAHNNLHDPVSIKSCLKLHNEGDTGAINDWAQYISIYDNVFESSLETPSVWQVGIEPQDVGADERIRYVVFERNFIENTNGVHNSMVNIAADFVTARHNVCRADNVTGNEPICIDALARRGVESNFPHDRVHLLYNTLSVSTNKSSDSIGVRLAATMTNSMSRGTLLHGFTGDDPQIGGDQANGLLVTTSPFVGPLTSFLGYLLSAASAPIDVGGTALLPGLVKDGALSPRMVNGTYDVGAFERQ